MSSVQHLRELMNERLTAAAEEIFRVFHKTIIEYEEEIDRQRRLLDIVWKPEINLHRIELPQQHVCKEEEEEVLNDQQLCNQERNSSLDQEDPEPPQIKEEEEEEELCTSLKGEQLVLKQEAETFMSTDACEESDNIKIETLDFMIEDVVSMSVKSSEVPETNNDNQLLFHNSHVAESQDHKGDEQKRHYKTESHIDDVCDPTTSTATCDENDLIKVENQDLSADESHHSHVAESQDHNRGSESTRNAVPKKRLDKSTHAENEDNSTILTILSNTYTAEKSFKCNTCGKAFKCKTKLHTHQRVHTGEKPYPCNICGRLFSEKAKVNRHMKTHTGEKPYPCNACEKSFSRLGSLKVHMRIHTGEKPYPCDSCEKSFSLLDTLKVHMRVHTGEKPYLCSTCGKSFSYLGAFKVHMRVHTGEKPYLCSTCGKRFSQLDTLKLHTRVHTGEKPYSCDTCGKRFSLVDTLKVHKRIHTGEKPYSCNTCEKRFYDLSSLKAHMRVHTGVD
ncbi:gastrula zinc finger protein XlCGF57.1-like [Scomber scombrus]|uniref:Gastrula zinc finger protein XlCGF57.1-like n=1 Tax=Scomber scombrus TaxID=13677 RepID=A0AAV1MVM2_SCOSC